MPLMKEGDLGIRGKSNSAWPRQIVSVLCWTVSRALIFIWQHNHEKGERENTRIIALRGRNSTLGHENLLLPSAPNAGNESKQWGQVGRVWAGSAGIYLKINMLLPNNSWNM